MKVLMYTFCKVSFTSQKVGDKNENVHSGKANCDEYDAG